MPTSAPTTLTTTKGQITTATPGEQITVLGTGFLPFSTATIVTYSSPVVLASVTTDGSGDFSKTVTVPTTLEAGSHNLVAYGVDSSGSVHSIRLAFSVTASAASSGTASGSSAATASLPSTGIDVGPALITGTSLLAAGVVVILVMYMRRRTALMREPDVAEGK
jgi:hypothetical protein